MAFNLKIGKGFHLTIGKEATTMNVGGTPAVSPFTGTMPGNNFYPEFMSSMVSFFGVNNNHEIYTAICECPQIAAIMFNKCNAHTNGKMQALQASNNNPVIGAKKDWQALLDRPNFLQNGEAFEAQRKFYIMGFGYCPELRIFPDGYDRGTVISARWLIPPDRMDIVWKKNVRPHYLEDIYELIDTVKVTQDDGTQYELKNVRDLYFHTDTTPLRYGSFLPTSRISYLKLPINNIVKGYKTEARIITKPLGFISNQAKDEISTIALDPEEKTELQGAFKTYGTGDGQDDVIISNATLNWNHMMYPVAQLQMIELRSANTAIICDGMGYPYDLMGKDKGSTFNNTDSADKRLFQNHIIPEARNLDTQTTECLFGKLNGVKYVTTFDHVPVLQKNEREKAQVRAANVNASKVEFDNNMATYNQVLVSNGREETTDPWGDMYAFQIRTEYPDFYNAIQQEQNTSSQNQPANEPGK